MSRGTWVLLMFSLGLAVGYVVGKTAGPLAVILLAAGAGFGLVISQALDHDDENGKAP